MEYRVRTFREIEKLINGKTHYELATILEGIAMWLCLQDGGDELYVDPNKEWEPYTL